MDLILITSTVRVSMSNLKYETLLKPLQQLYSVNINEHKWKEYGKSQILVLVCSDNVGLFRFFFFSDTGLWMKKQSRTLL